MWPRNVRDCNVFPPEASIGDPIREFSLALCSLWSSIDCYLLSKDAEFVQNFLMPAKNHQRYGPQVWLLQIVWRTTIRYFFPFLFHFFIQLMIGFESVGNKRRRWKNFSAVISLIDVESDENVAHALLRINSGEKYLIGCEIISLWCWCKLSILPADGLFFGCVIHRSAWLIAD